MIVIMTVAELCLLDIRSGCGEKERERERCGGICRGVGDLEGY